MPDKRKEAIEAYYAAVNREAEIRRKKLDESVAAGKARRGGLHKELLQLEGTTAELERVNKDLESQPGVGSSTRNAREFGQELAQPSDPNIFRYGRTGVTNLRSDTQPDYKNPPKTTIVLDPRGKEEAPVTLAHERMHRQEYLPLAQDYGPGGRIPGLARPPQLPRGDSPAERAAYGEAKKRFDDEQMFQRALESGDTETLTLLDALRQNRSLSDQHEAQRAYLADTELAVKKR